MKYKIGDRVRVTEGNLKGAVDEISGIQGDLYKLKSYGGWFSKDMLEPIEKEGKMDFPGFSLPENEDKEAHKDMDKLTRDIEGCDCKALNDKVTELCGNCVGNKKPGCDHSSFEHICDKCKKPEEEEECKHPHYASKLKEDEAACFECKDVFSVSEKKNKEAREDKLAGESKKLKWLESIKKEDSECDCSSTCKKCSLIYGNEESRKFVKKNKCDGKCDPVCNSCMDRDLRGYEEERKASIAQKKEECEEKCCCEGCPCSACKPAEWKEDLVTGGMCQYVGWEKCVFHGFRDKCAQKEKIKKPEEECKHGNIYSSSEKDYMECVDCPAKFNKKTKEWDIKRPSGKYIVVWDDIERGGHRSMVCADKSSALDFIEQRWPKSPVPDSTRIYPAGDPIEFEWKLTEKK